MVAKINEGDDRTHSLCIVVSLLHSIEQFSWQLEKCLYTVLLPLYHHPVITTAHFRFILSLIPIWCLLRHPSSSVYVHAEYVEARKRQPNERFDWKWYYGVIICNVYINIIKMHAPKMERIYRHCHIVWLVDFVGLGYV